jgi:hypothetical protein
MKRALAQRLLLQIRFRETHFLQNLKPISDYEKLFFPGKIILPHRGSPAHPFNFIVPVTQYASGLKIWCRHNESAF